MWLRLAWSFFPGRSAKAVDVVEILEPIPGFRKVEAAGVGGLQPVLVVEGEADQPQGWPSAWALSERASRAGVGSPSPTGQR